METSIRPLAVVTGASSGIGYELARQFAANGYDLVIVAEDSGVLDAATRLKVSGAAVDPVQADLAAPEGIERFYESIKDRAIDCIALNAGVGVGGDFARDTSLFEELNMINLNVTGVVHLTKLVVPGMIKRGHGRILFTASIASVMPSPYLAVYGGTKAFILSFAEALRNELKDTGVTVTALMPGPTATNFFDRAHMESTRAATDEKDDPADVAEQGFKALMQGKDHIVAGSVKVKMQGLMAELTPEAMKAEQSRKSLKPGTAESKENRD